MSRGIISESRTKGVLVLSRPLENKKAHRLETKGFGGTNMQNITLDTISVSSLAQAFDMFSRLRDAMTARKEADIDIKLKPYMRLLKHAYYRCPKQHLSAMYLSMRNNVLRDDGVLPAYRAIMIGIVRGRSPRLASKLERAIV